MRWQCAILLDTHPEVSGDDTVARIDPTLTIGEELTGMSLR